MKTVVLLSGGLDSAVNLKCALDDGEIRLAVTFDYGQAAFEDEARAAAAMVERYGVRHTVVNLPWYRDLVANPLMGKGAVGEYAAGITSSPADLLGEAWIPNRNCVFLSIGAAYAESLKARGIVVGFNREEAGIFPDNSLAFLEAVNQALKLSTLSDIEVVCYTIGMTKAEIVALGVEIAAPLDLIYSCYRPSRDERMCGLCQSCVRVKAALAENGQLEGLAGRFAA
jgi:7-cyano-7-deazaguanine synthase